MAKDEKSKAEIYREERKERIATAAKKNSKKKIKSPKAKRAIKAVLITVITLAIVAGAAFFVLDNTGTFVKMQTALTVGETKVSVAEYGYLYYLQYNNVVNTSYQYQQQYGYNVYGFDYALSPEEQDYTDSDGKKIKWSEQLTNQTVDFIQEFYSLYHEAIAKGYKITEEELKDIDASIDELRATAAGTDTQDSSQSRISMSLNSYLKVYYGKGITEGFMRNLMEKQAITQRYSEDKQKEFEDKYTDAKLDAEYKKDVDSYDVVDLRSYTFPIETLKADDGETDDQLKVRQDAEKANVKAEAEAFLAKATDEKAFLAAAKEQKAAEDAKAQEEEAAAAEDSSEEGTPDTAEESTTEAAAEPTTEAVTEPTTETAADKDDKAADDTAATEEEAAVEEDAYDAEKETRFFYKTKETMTSSISEEAAKWAFADGRKVGEVKLFTTDTACYVVIVKKAQYPLPTVDVRHILFMTVDSSSGEALSDEEIKEKKTKCDSVYDTWEKSGTKTEEYFGQLATENSEDTGSTENGGLYENTTPGQMVDEFDQWIFDKSRKVGDTDIIESDYGYHIMYYVGNPSYNYRVTLRTSHTQDDYSGWLEKEIAKDSSKIIKNTGNMATGYTRAYKLIDSTVENIKAQQAQQQQSAGASY